MKGPCGGCNKREICKAPCERLEKMLPSDDDGRPAVRERLVTFTDLRWTPYGPKDIDDNDE